MWEESWINANFSDQWGVQSAQSAQPLGLFPNTSQMLKPMRMTQQAPPIPAMKAGCFTTSVICSVMLLFRFPCIITSRNSLPESALLPAEEVHWELKEEAQNNQRLEGERRHGRILTATPAPREPEGPGIQRKMNGSNDEPNTLVRLETIHRGEQLINHRALRSPSPHYIQYCAALLCGLVRACMNQALGDRSSSQEEAAQLLQRHACVLPQQTDPIFQPADGGDGVSRCLAFQQCHTFHTQCLIGWALANDGWRPLGYLVALTTLGLIQSS
ncbi:hypothetical protein EYF80_016780 [Liparis tanakae]|uniref:Uncharacterized protein n=1 Tax=Liparis tanakae TaxID=230148 RepID=A0A4Z2I587_9TELE|nr:hypothetical protein EYF80_016780 [Liparis tanakae]